MSRRIKARKKLESNSGNNPKTPSNVKRFGLYDHLRDKSKSSPEPSGSSHLLRNSIIGIGLMILLVSMGFFAADVVPETFAPRSTEDKIEVYEVENAVYSITLYADPDCGCCGSYVQYLLNLDIEVEFVRTRNYIDIKEDNNLPTETYSCHTAIYGYYFVEGHVPIDAIDKLLEELPDISGISLPDMPTGSPGMGSGPGPFEVLSIKDGIVLGIFITI